MPKRIFLLLYIPILLIGFLIINKPVFAQSNNSVVEFGPVEVNVPDGYQNRVNFEITVSVDPNFSFSPTHTFRSIDYPNSCPPRLNKLGPCIGAQKIQGTTSGEVYLKITGIKIILDGNISPNDKLTKLPEKTDFHLSNGGRTDWISYDWMLAPKCSKIERLFESPTSGSTSTNFTFTGTITNCPNATGEAELRLFAENPSGGDPVSQKLETDEFGNFMLSNVIFPNPGTWNVGITYTATPITNDNPLKLNITQDSQPQCGAYVEANSTRCPNECPAISLPGSNQWKCEGGDYQNPVKPKVTTVTSAAGETCYGDNSYVKTAIGCVPTEPKGFILGLLRLATGVGGGIAFLLMIIGAFQMITSAGNPESLKAGQERFKDAIIGLLFIIFSVLLLRIIGVDILNFGAFLGVS